MDDLRLYAVTSQGAQSLPTPEDANSIHTLYAEMPLGVYSTLRSFEQYKFLGLDEHIERTKRSMELMGWQEPLDEMRLRVSIDEVVRSYPHPNARVRFDVLAKPIEVAGEQTRLLIGVAPFEGIPPELYHEGVKVGFAERLKRDNPLAKTAVFVNQRQAFPTGSTEMYERLLINDDGDILECTSSNFYAVIDRKLYTAAQGILEGITRKIILDLVRQSDIPLVLEAPNVADIANFEEAGLSSSSRAIIPVVQIGEQVIGNGRPGPIMQQLLAAYEAYVTQAIKPAA